MKSKFIVEYKYRGDREWCIQSIRDTEVQAVEDSRALWKSPRVCSVRVVKETLEVIKAADR